MNGRDKLREAAAGLMDLADALEGDDDLAERVIATAVPIVSYLYTSDKTNLQELVRRFAPVEKLESETDYRLVRHFGPHVRVKLLALRQNICEQEVVGKKKVKVTRTVTPEITEEVEVEIDDIRWICPDSILDNGVVPSSELIMRKSILRVDNEEIQTTQGEQT